MPRRTTPNTRPSKNLLSNGALKNPRHEIFAVAVANGVGLEEAYEQAGYTRDDRNARALFRRPTVANRIKFLVTRKAAVEEIATQKIMTKFALTKESAAEELKLLAFARMGDYMRKSDGTLIVDVGEVSPEQLAAVQEYTIETYVEGKGKDAQAVKRVRIKLYDKRQAIMDLARLMGWIVDKKDLTVRLEEKLATMTPEELDEDARQLAIRARRLLAEKQAEHDAADRAAAVDAAGKAGGIGYGQITDVEPEEGGDEDK